MRNVTYLSGFLLCLLATAPVMADDILPTPQDMHDQATAGVNSVKKAASDAQDTFNNALPPLSGAPALSDTPAQKAAASSLSVAPPVQIAPAPAVAAPAKTIANAPAASAPPSIDAPATLPVPTQLATPAATPMLAPQDAQKAMAAPDANKSPSILPLPDPSMLPSPGNAASSMPSLPFSVPDAAKATTSQDMPPAITPPAITSPLPAVSTPVVESNVAPKKHTFHHTHFAGNNKVPYRNIRMPATIYKKHYDSRNKDLPVAMYERDEDALVFVAAQRDDLNGVRSLLDYGKRKINHQDSRGKTALIVAAKHNSYNVVRLLLGRHADASIKDADGMTALHYAERDGHGRIANVIRTMTEGTQVATTTSASIGGTTVQLMKPKQDLNE